MKSFITSALIGSVLIGCSTLTPSQKQIVDSAGILAQEVATIVVNVVVSKAISQEDLSAKSNFLDSAALGLRSLESNTSGILSPEIVQSAILNFTDPQKTHWIDLAKEVSQKIVESPAPPKVALEQAAIGLNTASATIRQGL